MKKIRSLAVFDGLITGPGSASKEQGEKSCIVSHNNIIFTDKFVLFYNSACL